MEAGLLLLESGDERLQGAEFLEEVFVEERADAAKVKVLVEGPVVFVDQH